MDILTDSERAFRLGLLLIDGFSMMSYAATIEPLQAANAIAGRTLYDIRHIPVFGASSTGSGGAVVRASGYVGESVDFGLLLVIAGGDSFAFREARVFQWLRHLSRRGVRLGGVSGGAVILALAGLMNRRRMTVQREHAAAVAAFSPLSMVERSLYVIDRNRITCAGGIAPLELMHALLSEHHGAEFARRVSQQLMYTEICLTSGPQRANLVAKYGTTNHPVILAIEVMGNHIADTLTLVQLADLAELGPRQLNRLFREKLGQSTMNFYLGLRLDKARELLIQTPMSAAEIALATGFSSSAHFSQSFRSRFNRTSSSLRQP